MRVTPKMISDQMISNLNRNLERLQRVQWQLSTGKKIGKPSDDPVGISMALRYRSELAANEQYQRNLDAALSWLENADSMVGQAVQVIHRVRYLTVQGATESNSELSLRTIAEEMKELKEQLYEVANSQFNGKYIFNGHRTDQAPYPDHDYQQAQLGTGEIKYEVARGVEITINQLAEEIFGPAGDPDDPDNDNLFAILDRIITALEAADPEAVGRELGALDRRMDIILERWAEIGARYNRLELMNNRMQDENLNLKTVLSKTEDADLAEVIIRLRTEENIYRSSLAAGARIIQPSLIDFLR